MDLSHSVVVLWTVSNSTKKRFPSFIFSPKSPEIGFNKVLSFSSWIRRSQPAESAVKSTKRASNPTLQTSSCRLHDIKASTTNGREYNAFFTEANIRIPKVKTRD